MAQYINSDSRTAMSEERFTAKCVDNPLISDAIAVDATGTTQAVAVPDNAFVEKVGLYAKGALSTAEIDVGDGDVADRYLDGVTTIAAGDMKQSGLAGAVDADPVTGHYYSSSDTIDVTVVATGASGGTLLLFVWYDIMDGESL